MSEVVFGVAALTFLSLTACARAPSTEGPAAEPSAPAEIVAHTRTSRNNPFDFEAGALEAQVHDYALVPSRSTIHEAFERGFEQQTFVYLGARLEQIFEKESRVRWLTGQQALVPNALIIPIRRGARANVGAIVLTSWAGGGGLQRARVVAGGTPESPKVRYLDLPLDGPAATPAEVLAPDTFHVLGKASEVGSTVACAASDRVERWIVVKRSGERALGLGFAGKMRVLELGTCAPLPLTPNVEPGARVYVPHLGSFVAASVEAVDVEAGRVRARFDWAGEVRRPSVGYTNVALTLPGIR